MTTTKTSPSPEKRIQQRSQQLAGIDARREEISTALDGLEVDFSAAVANCETTTGLSAKRRALLDELSDLDRAAEEVQRHVDAANAEITERDARAELARMREELPRLVAAAHERAAGLLPELDNAARSVLDAAVAFATLVGEVRDDEDRISALSAGADALAVRFGEEPPAVAAPHLLDGAYRDLGDHVPKARVLIAAQQPGLRDVVWRLGELAVFVADEANTR